jgi:hypothetical protein
LADSIKGLEGRLGAEEAIVGEASNEDSPARQSMPQTKFNGQYFKCYWGDLQNVSLPKDHLSVTDEKDREWHCFPIPKEEVETEGFAELFSMLGGKPSTHPFRLAIVLCKDQAELPVKLTEQLDF